MNYHQGATLQRGYGIGGLFSAFSRMLLPAIKTGLSGATKAVAKFAGSNLAKSGAKEGKKLLKGIAVDALKGENVLKGSEKRLTASRKRIAQQIEEEDNGMPQATKRRHKKRKMLAKKRFRKRKRQFALLNEISDSD